MSYTQSIILRVNTSEVRRRFEGLGYKVLERLEGAPIIYTHNGHLSYLTGLDDTEGCIDCGTNIELALALAALRDDSDAYQWFVDGKEWTLCLKENGLEYFLFDFPFLHKATPEELIEHFRKEEV